MQTLPANLLRALSVNNDFEITTLPGNENQNYLLKSAHETLVVKRLRAHTAENTELEGLYRAYLAKAGLPVAGYLPFSDKSYVFADNGDNYVATRYVPGQMSRAVTAQLVVQTAALLAKTHSLDTSSLPERHSWFRSGYIGETCALLDPKFSGTRQDLINQAAHLPDFWDEDIHQGIIHGDLHKENIISDDVGNIVSIVDWEETSVKPVLLDVAYCVRSMVFDNGVCNQALFDAFFLSYQAIRPLSALEKSLFTAALRYTNLVFSSWAHLKASQHQMNDEILKVFGNVYRLDYDVPAIV